MILFSFFNIAEGTPNILWFLITWGVVKCIVMVYICYQVHPTFMVKGNAKLVA